MNFNRFYYPIGLAYISAILKQNGHETLIYDAEHDPYSTSQSWLEASGKYQEYISGLQNEAHYIWNELRDLIKEFKPDAIGISMLSVKYPSARFSAKICKEFDPDVPVICGADHPTVFPNIVLEDKNIDFVVRGEGELTILELVNALEKGTGFKDIKGISYKHHGQVIHNPDRELIPDLNTLPYPAITSLKNFETYRPLDFGAIMASRGCPFLCTFCGVCTIWTHKVRYRDPITVFEEMKMLYNTYNTDFFSFRDPSFTLHKNRIIELCNLIKASGMNIKWECTTRADLFDIPLLKLMTESGCVNIRLGIESGSKIILEKMKKNIDLEVVKSAAKLLNGENVYWSAYFLFGTPDETRETIEETVKFIDEIDPPFVTIARFTPLPGTEMYMELEDAGLINPYTDWCLEGNQSYQTHYVTLIDSKEFESIMYEIALKIDKRNALKKPHYGKGDLRLKD